MAQFKNFPRQLLPISSVSGGLVWDVSGMGIATVNIEATSWGSAVVTFKRSNDPLKQQWYDFATVTTLSANGMVTLDVRGFAYLKAECTTAHGSADKTAFATAHALESQRGLESTVYTTITGYAPVDADYLVKTANSTLTAERVVTDSTSVTWDWTVGGQAIAKRAALTGDVTAGADSNATTIANDAVTFAKMQDIATDRLLGRDTAGTGNVEELTVGGGVEFTGSGGIQTSAFTGDVTKTAGGTATTIANDAVTNAKLADMATARIKGRVTAGSGDPEDLTGTQATTLLDAMVGDAGAGGTKGLAPAPSAGDAAAGKYLKADGTWAVPPGGGGGDNVTVNGAAVVDADFDDATPAAPAGDLNVKWQKDGSSPANVSAYVDVSALIPLIGHDHTSSTDGGVLTGDKHDSYSDWTESAAPANPAANDLRFSAIDSNGVTVGRLVDSAGNVTLVGHNEYAVVYNDTGFTISKGAALALAPGLGSGTFPGVILADADDLADIPCFALAAQSITTGSWGLALKRGLLTGIDTSSLSAGYGFYLSNTAGALTTLSTGLLSRMQVVGVCIVSDASAGSVYVDPYGYDYNASATRAASGLFQITKAGSGARQLWFTNASGTITMSATPGGNRTITIPDATGTDVIASSTSTTTTHAAFASATAGVCTFRAIAAGTDLSGQVPLANGGTGANLSDPNADRILFWDDSAGQVTWLTLGTNLTITGTTIDAAGGSGLTYGEVRRLAFIHG